MLTDAAYVRAGKHSWIHLFYCSYVFGVLEKNKKEKIVPQTPHTAYRVLLGFPKLTEAKGIADGPTNE